MPKITKMQQAFLSSLKEDDQLEAMKRFISASLFYADVIETGSGFSVASTEDLDQIASMPFPDLHLEKHKAQEEVEEIQESYKDDVFTGERDPDDEYEGVVMSINWADDDNLHFYDAETHTLIGTAHATDAMGL